MSKKTMKCPKCDRAKAKDGPTEGGSEKPMQRMMRMCEEMLGAMRKTNEMAVFTIPELRRLFEEWLEAMEAEALKTLREGGAITARDLAASLGISEEGATYLIARLKNQGKIDLRAQPL